MRAIHVAITLQTLWMFSGCCGHVEMYRYEWERVKAGSLDNTAAAPVEVSGAPIPARAYGIRMTLSHRQMVAAAPMNFGGVPTAYATSCEPTFEFIPLDTVERIEVIAINGLAAPIDATDRFVATESPSYGAPSFKDFVEIEEIAEQLNRKVMEQIDLFLLRDPESLRGTDLRFAVTLRMTSGKIIADTTLPATLY